MKIYRGLPESYLNPGRKLLRANPPIEDDDKLEESEEVIFSAKVVGWCGFLSICMLIVALLFG